jgi:hypothetical protein
MLSNVNHASELAMNMSNKTFKTDNKSIPYISIDEQFLLNNGNIVTLISVYQTESFEIDPIQTLYPFGFYNINLNRVDVYNTKLSYDNIGDENYELNIDCKYIPLKDKVNSL